jgi:hypothetical protein
MRQRRLRLAPDPGRSPTPRNTVRRIAASNERRSRIQRNLRIYWNGERHKVTKDRERQADWMPERGPRALRQARGPSFF